MKMKLTLVIQAIEEASDAYTLFYDTKEEKTVYLLDATVTGKRDKLLKRYRAAI